LFPELRGDILRAVSPVKKLIQKGAQATSRLMGTQPPTVATAEQFLHKHKIPEHLIHQVIHDLGIMPHVTQKAADLHMDKTELKQIWDRRLAAAGVSNRVERMDIMTPFVNADITVWMPTF
jgi:hypothetical protein